MAAKTTPKTLLAPVRNSAHGLPLRGIRTIVSKSTGAQNYVLCFDNAEVVMPGTWTIREDQFPDGLVEGLCLDAYWEKDAEGVDRFHLSIAL